MILSDALDRTLLLMRDEVGDAPPDDVLIEALTSTSVALVVDAANIASHAAQSAFVTAALLMARSAHRVFLVAPETTLGGPQPPLPRGPMLEGLAGVGGELLPGLAFTIGPPAHEVDLLVAFGDTPLDLPARRRIRVNAEPWAGSISAWDAPRRWTPTWWPMGGLAAGALVAGEAFKTAMLKLLPYALNPQMTASVFAFSDQAHVQLAPAGTPFHGDLGDVDFISGGAINSSALFAIARLPGVHLRGRIVEPDTFAASNLNRYMLMLRSHDGLGKAATLRDLLQDLLDIEAVPARYEPGCSLDPLAGRVVIGVDDIPTRWAVQRSGAGWLTIGATTHWSSMASFHTPGLGCAQCLHPEDEPGDAAIPTQACVSFWAGLHAAAYLIRVAAGVGLPAIDQHLYMTPFRPDQIVGGAVRTRPGCPTCGGWGVRGGARAA
ncbi:MAG: ThiF family adenylyltransferase [Phenylobacterium sp.]|uniref:hypothetical protein n=1 Tax=Phenylobacterium sp. TaxID=1871053 RepID=UPI001A217256|nr:hypothetical protein [Phenylobacterium sp.]MBJ7410396.1 ThiF family adenylyltransferase [Phenylobacterium sp.]